MFLLQVHTDGPTDIVDYWGFVNLKNLERANYYKCFIGVLKLINLLCCDVNFHVLNHGQEIRDSESLVAGHSDDMFNENYDNIVQYTTQALTEALQVRFKLINS